MNEDRRGAQRWQAGDHHLPLHGRPLHAALPQDAAAGLGGFQYEAFILNIASFMHSAKLGGAADGGTLQELGAGKIRGRSLKLVRSSLVSAPENEPSLNRLEKLWASQLADSVGAVGFEVIVKAGDVSATVGELKSLKKGDFLPFENGSNPELFVNGFAIFDVEIGSQGDMTAVKIQKSKASEVAP